MKILDIFNSFHSDPEKILDQNIRVVGRVYTSRTASNGDILFIHLIDCSTVQTLQCICDKGAPSYNPELFKLFESSYRGSVLILCGKIIRSVGSGQPIELVITKCEYIGKNMDPSEYPFASRGFISQSLTRSLPHLRHHLPHYIAIQKIKQITYKAWHDSMEIQGIGEVQPTIITSNECESGAHPFTVTTIQDSNYSNDFFHQKVFLTVSSQLHLEATVCGTLMDGYCMTPAFRAEPSTGPLHLSEFTMPEWELIDCDLAQNMLVGESAIKHCINTVLKYCRLELEALEKYHVIELGHELEHALAEHKKLKSSMKKKLWVQEKVQIEAQFDQIKKRPGLIQMLEQYGSKPFNKITHSDCVKKMIDDSAQNKVQFRSLPTYDGDLDKEHERYVAEVMFESNPVFITHYPKAVKAFYMPVVHKTEFGEFVDCFDLIFPYIGEVVGGSQRIDSYSDLEIRMTESGISTESLQWYLDLRKYGSVPHGGAGIGWGRLLMVLTGMKNIKDLQEFPRGFGVQIIG